MIDFFCQNNDKSKSNPIVVPSEYIVFTELGHIDVHEDPFAWWHNMSALLPVSARLARHYLAIPANFSCCRENIL